LPSLKLPCSPVHGGWSNWKKSFWNFCIQYRTCTNPKPNACGNKCVGKSTRRNPNCILQEQQVHAKFPQPSLWSYHTVLRNYTYYCISVLHYLDNLCIEFDFPLCKHYAINLLAVHFKSLNLYIQEYYNFVKYNCNCYSSA
jgi:hypothetical protein